VALAVCICLLGGATPARAESSFELYTGLYVPGIDDLDNDMTFGLRYGQRPNPQWGWNLEAGYLDLNQNNTRPLDGAIGDANGYFVDGNVIWYPGGYGFGVFAGIGFGTVDIDITGTTADASDDAFTYNYGTHYVWNIGTKYLVKPEVRWRKWDGDTYEKTDEEYTLSFGWRF
jgi:hypothetical protein